MQIREDIKSLKDEIIIHRRHFHEYPEIRLDTPKSAEYIEKVLRDYGYTNITQGMAKNAIIASLEVIDGNYIGFRSDMDALPIIEATGLPFASNNDYAHMCGHDGHMAALLGFAKYVIDHKDKLKHNVCFIFQPGEEGPGGAEILINEGLFKKYPMAAIFGCHLMGEVSEGVVASRSGAMMARNGEFNIKVQGKGTHGATPHLGKDAIVASAALIQSLQTIVSRSINPLEQSVVSVGSIHGGSAENIIAEEVIMEGTIRAFNDETYEMIKSRIMQITDGIAQSYDLEVITNIEDYYYVVNNDLKLFQLLDEVCNGIEVIEPKMIAEDFSFYQREVPGLFYYVGTNSVEHPHHLHSNKFTFNEDILLTIVEVNARLLESLGDIHD